VNFLSRTLFFGFRFTIDPCFKPYGNPPLVSNSGSEWYHRFRRMTEPHKEKDVLSPVPCPRCSCYLVRHFDCFCGEVHSDYCSNCRRWTSLELHEYAEMDAWNEVCRAGPVIHVHTAEEQSQRLKKQLDMVKQYEKLFKWRDMLTDRYGEDLIWLLAGLGGYPADFRLPPELVSAWESFGKLDEDTRFRYAKAFVQATEPTGIRSYGSYD